MRNFTPEDLLEFHYNELSQEEATLIISELNENWALGEKLAVIREATKRLDKSIEKPRMQVVTAILGYAARHEKAVIF